MWGVGASFVDTPHGGDGVSDADVIKALNSKVRILISGHLHFFEMIVFDNEPPQMISGGGATELDTKVSPEQFKQGLSKIGALGKDPNAPNKPASEVIYDFTFSYIDVESDSWKIAVMDQNGMTELGTYTIDKK